MSDAAQTREESDKPGSEPLKQPFGPTIPAILVALPACLFYMILFRKAIDLPTFDDYALLLFLNQEIALKGFSAKASCFLASQHNEYKVFFARGIAWLQYVIFGHLDFRVLSALGNGFVILLGILLWKMFLPTHRNLAVRLAFFVPVSWLLFQLQYWETLDWPLPGLQNVPVLVFSFGAIYLLTREDNWGFGASVASLVLAIASSGNGFLVIPIGVLILLQGRKYLRILIWLSTSAACLVAYAYRYNSMSSQADAHRSVFSVLLHLNPVYAIAFIGSAGSIPFRVGAFVLGLVLCGFFVFLASRGYAKRSPVVSYCVLFLLLTAIGVAGIRSELGVMQSMQSRYTIYSALFLIFAWFAIVQEFLLSMRGSLLSNRIYLGVLFASVAFSLLMDAEGAIGIESRSRTTVNGMTEFEHSLISGSNLGPIRQFSSPEERAKFDAFSKAARRILIDSIQLGVYRPPFS